MTINYGKFYFEEKCIHGAIKLKNVKKNNRVYYQSSMSMIL